MTSYEDLNWKDFNITAILGDLLLHEVDATEKVRPVINIYKDKINDLDEQSAITNNDESTSNDYKTTNTTSGKVKVDDTLLKYFMIGAIVVLILVGSGIFMYEFMKIHSNKSK